MTTEAKRPSPPGPVCYRNWQAQVSGDPLFLVGEFPLYSDAPIRIPDQPALSMGPYVLISAHPARPPDPSLILVLNTHLDPTKLPAFSETDISGFSGSEPEDELAALLSLELGTRLMAGGMTRCVQGQQVFVQGDTGRPLGFWGLERRHPVLPRAIAPKQLTAALTSSLPRLSAESAIALVRAARSYRDALWIVESEPELAWLLFVSALEVAAVHQQVEQTPPAEILRMSKPKLVQQLDSAGGGSLVQAVADELKRELRATARFLDFTMKFMPEAPDKRPPAGFQFEWTQPKLKAAMKKVYEHRSKALHEGIPFPAPMCRPPMLSGIEWEAPIETVPGLAGHAVGGVWLREDTPFSLHMFEYITRGALLKWWTTLAASVSNGSN